MFAVDLTWEFSEYFLWQNHNWLDLVWNTIGILLGMTARYIYDIKRGAFKKKHTPGLKVKTGGDSPRSQHSRQSVKINLSQKEDSVHSKDSFHSQLMKRREGE